MKKERGLDPKTLPTEKVDLPKGFVLKDGTVVDRDMQVTVIRDPVTSSRIIQAPIHLAWLYVP